MSDYLEGHKKSGLQVGDFVKVFREFYHADKQMWRVLVLPSHNYCFVGKIGQIMLDRMKDGFEVRFADENRSILLPYSVLQKVSPLEGRMYNLQIALNDAMKAAKWENKPEKNKELLEACKEMAEVLKRYQPSAGEKSWTNE